MDVTAPPRLPRRRDLLALGATAALSALARAARADPPPAPPLPPSPVDLLPPGEATVFTLPNGLTVALQVDRASAQAALRVKYAVGAGDDPDGYRGLAHLAEHLTYGATRHVREGLLDAIDALGSSSYNGVTSVDDTSYYATVPAEALERALYYEAERMAFGLDAITPAWLAHEQAVVCTEHADRFGDSPTDALFDAVQATLYPPGHRYHAYGDRPDDVRAVTVDGARWFVQRWYVPAAATLAVVGNFDPDRTRAFIERHFGTIATQRRPRPARDAPAVPLARPGVVTFEAPVRGEKVQFFWLTPALWTAEDAALDFASSVLVSRLREALVHRRRLAYAVGARQESRATTSTFTLATAATPGADLADLLAEATTALQRARSAPVQEGEFRGAVVEWTRRAVARGASAQSRAAAAVQSPLPDDLGRLRGNLARYAALTPADVDAALRRHLDPAQGLAVEVRSNPRASANGEVTDRRPHR